MAWQAEFVVNGAVDQCWHDLTQEQLDRLIINLRQDWLKERWPSASLYWWPEGEAQGEWGDQDGGVVMWAAER